MSTLEFLNLQHESVIKSEQTLEKAALELLKNRHLMDRKEFHHFVSMSTNIFENDLPMHFSIEESIIFPIMEEKLQDGSKIVSNLISEHRNMTKEFNEIKYLDDHNKLIKRFTELMKTLSNHAKEEDKLFSSVHFSKDELSFTDKKARSLGFGIYY